MSAHNRALVPISAWHFNSPDVRASGRHVDLGLFAEALLYYDHVSVNVTTQPEFAEFLGWFVGSDQFDDLTRLIEDGTVSFYEYAFASLPFQHDGTYGLVNVQDQTQAKPNSFVERVIEHPDVRKILVNPRNRRNFNRSIEGHFTEVKADQFGRALENAMADLRDPKRAKLIVQSYIDELWRFKSLGKPPEIDAVVRPASTGGQYAVAFSIDFKELSRIGGDALMFHVALPLNAAAASTRLLWSAAQLECDLYLPRPMSTLVGNKMYESVRVSKTAETIQSLEKAVDFPDVRALVNEGKLRFSDILALRKKSRKFREWLQAESGRDRDAIIAYHQEVAKESGLIQGGRKTLSLFGVVGGAVLGAIWSGPVGAAVGAGAGYIMDVASKMDSDWHPVVFGNWMRARIEKLLEDDTNT